MTRDIITASQVTLEIGQEDDDKVVVLHNGDYLGSIYSGGWTSYSHPAHDYVVTTLGINVREHLGVKGRLTDAVHALLGLINSA